MASGSWRAAWLAVVMMLVAATGGTASAELADPAGGDPQAVFDDAFGRVKKLMADMTVLQAQYQQPKADKAALEARFEAVKQEAATAVAELEASAVELLAVKPDSEAARQVAAGVLAGGLQADDPAKTLAVAASLEQAGAIDADTAMMAATAAVVLSRLDEAEAWLERAKAEGAAASATGDLQATIDRNRTKVDAEMARRKAEAEADDLPRVKISTSAGDLIVELFENEAPNTVANFITLIEKGFYDGTPFHRVIGGFMAQGGDPTGTGAGGPGHAIPCECDGDDARLHFRGSLSMAHAGEDTGGSQFFLTFRPTDHLDGRHTVFGRVIEGDEVLAKLARTQDSQGRPVPGVEPDTIVKAEVVRKRNHPYVAETLPDPRAR